MNRLTERLPNGVLRPRIVSGDSVMHRLAAYEDNGQTPEKQAAMIVENAELHDAMKGAMVITNQAKGYIAESARLRAELEAAKEDLALIPSICFGNCSGDHDVGVSDCPFYDYAEPDERGYPQSRKCRYMTPDAAPNISPRCAPTTPIGCPFDEPNGPCAKNGGTRERG